MKPQLYLVQAIPILRPLKKKKKLVWMNLRSARIRVVVKLSQRWRIMTLPAVTTPDLLFFMIGWEGWDHLFTKLKIHLFLSSWHLIIDYQLLILILFMFDLKWQCCNIHVKEFDEFMDIAPCSRGWHNAGPA